MAELDIHYRDLQESDAERELQLYGNDETFIHGIRSDYRYLYHFILYPWFGAEY